MPGGLVIMVCAALSYRYPNPSPHSYENRLFLPFEYALQPPDFYKPAHIAVKKPELPKGVQSLGTYEGPQCFAIPGNHGVCLLSLQLHVCCRCHKQLDYLKYSLRLIKIQVFSQCMLVFQWYDRLVGWA